MPASTDLADGACDLIRGAGMISIIIPAYNEESRLPGAIVNIHRFLTAHAATFEVVVVDDGSRDRSGEIVRQHQAICPTLRLIRLPRNQGKGAAVKAGILEGRGRFLVFTDADQSTSIDQLPKLLRPVVEEGFDIAIGSRAVRGAKILRGQGWSRQFLGQTFGWCAKLLLVRGYRDSQCGFKCYRREVALKIFPQLTSPTVLFDLEALLLAARAGYRVAEVPVTWVHHSDSRLRYSLRKGLWTFGELLRLRRQWGVRWPARLEAVPWHEDTPD